MQTKHNKQKQNKNQFWKAKSRKNSYEKMQDSLNKFITEKEFKLDRDNIGSNIQHQTKLEYQIAENKTELEEIIKVPLFLILTPY